MQEIYEYHRDDTDMPWIHAFTSCPCMPHLHAGIELVYVHEGALHVTVDEKSLTVHAGQMLIVSSYMLHQYEADTLNGVLCIIPMNAVPVLKKMLQKSRFRSLIATDDDERTLHTLMTLMLRVDGHLHALQGLSAALLGYLIDHIGLDATTEKDHTSLLCRILLYLNDHFTDTLTVETIAHRFGYSRSRLSHLFKSSVGCSLPQYINTLRVHHAAQLLGGDMTIAQIAEECGFGNARSFYTAFRSVYGTPPGAYQRLNT